MRSRKRKKKTPRDGEIIAIVARNVRWYREKCELSQTALARLSGVALSTLNEIENLVANDVRLSTISALSQALGLAPQKLFQDVNFLPDGRERKEFLVAFRLLERIAKRMGG